MIRQQFAETLHKELLTAGLPLDEWSESYRCSDQRAEFVASNFSDYLTSPSTKFATIVEVRWFWDCEDATRASAFGKLCRSQENLKDWEKFVFVTMTARCRHPQPVRLSVVEGWHNALTAEFGEWLPLAACTMDADFFYRLPLTMAFTASLDRGSLLLSRAESFSRHEIHLWAGGSDAPWKEAVSRLGRNLGAAWQVWQKHAARLPSLK